MASGSDVPKGRAKGVGKAMSWVLRHGAPEVGVAMRTDAFVKLSDLLACPNMRKLRVTKEEVLWVSEGSQGSGVHPARRACRRSWRTTTRSGMMW